MKLFSRVGIVVAAAVVAGGGVVPATGRADVATRAGFRRFSFGAEVGHRHSLLHLGHAPYLRDPGKPMLRLGAEYRLARDSWLIFTVGGARESGKSCLRLADTETPCSLPVPMSLFTADAFAGLRHVMFTERRFALSLYGGLTAGWSQLSSKATAGEVGVDWTPQDARLLELGATFGVAAEYFFTEQFALRLGLSLLEGNWYRETRDFSPVGDAPYTQVKEGFTGGLGLQPSIGFRIRF